MAAARAAACGLEGVAILFLLSSKRRKKKSDRKKRARQQKRRKISGRKEATTEKRASSPSLPDIYFSSNNEIVVIIALVSLLSRREARKVAREGGARSGSPSHSVFPLFLATQHLFSLDRFHLEYNCWLVLLSSLLALSLSTPESQERKLEAKHPW